MLVAVAGVVVGAATLLDGTKTAPGDVDVFPKLPARSARSATSTLPSPLKSPCAQVMPLELPKLPPRLARSVTSTLLSRFVSPSITGGGEMLVDGSYSRT